MKCASSPDTKSLVTRPRDQALGLPQPGRRAENVGRKPRNSTESPDSARPQLWPGPALLPSKSGAMLTSPVWRRTNKLPKRPRGPDLIAAGRGGGRGPR